MVPVVAEGLPEYCAPAANTLKYIEVVPVIVVVVVIALLCQAFDLSHTPVLPENQVLPFVLVITYQFPEADQLLRKL